MMLENEFEGLEKAKNSKTLDQLDGQGSEFFLNDRKQISSQKSLNKASALSSHSQLWDNLKIEKDKIYEIKIEFPKDLKVEESIYYAIKEFNQLLKNSGKDQLLSTNPIEYDIYFAKKSGKPKDDYPALDPNQILSQTKALLLVIIEKQSRMQSIAEIFIEDEKVGSDEKQGNKQPSYPQIPADFAKNTQMRRTSNSSFDEEIIEESSCLCFKFRKSKRGTKKK